jgi:hypothetical protein
MRDFMRITARDSGRGAHAKASNATSAASTPDVLRSGRAIEANRRARAWNRAHNLALRLVAGQLAQPQA